jgi:hypothetical protein
MGHGRTLREKRTYQLRLNGRVKPVGGYAVHFCTVWRPSFWLLWVCSLYSPEEVASLHPYED